MFGYQQTQVAGRGRCPEIDGAIEQGEGEPVGEIRNRDQVEGEIRARGRATDVYIGVAPRGRPAGGRDAIERLHVLWADLDTPESIDALARFDPEPSIVARRLPDCRA